MNTTWLDVFSSVVAFILVMLGYGIGFGILGSIAYLIFSYLTGVTL